MTDRSLLIANARAGAWVSAEWFGAVATATAAANKPAFDLADVDGRSIYIPPGDFATTAVPIGKYFGDGRILVDGVYYALNSIAAPLAAITPASLTDEATLRAFGASFNGVNDDAPAIRAMYASMPRGGTIRLPALITTILTPSLFQDKPLRLLGSGVSYANGQATALSVKCADAFVMANTDGFEVSDMFISGSGAALTSGNLFAFQRSTSSVSNSGMVRFANLRVQNLYNGWLFNQVFNIHMDNVKTTSFRGESVLFFNGQSDDAQANAFCATDCTFSCGSYPGTGVIFDGRSGSAKFDNCNILFGGTGVWLRNTATGPARTIASISQSPDSGGFRIVTTVSHGITSDKSVFLAGVTGTTDITGQYVVDRIDAVTLDLRDTAYPAGATYSGGTIALAIGGNPGSIYWSGGGFENNKGDLFKLDAGQFVQITNALLAADEVGCGIRAGEGFGGTLLVNNSIIKGNPRDGVRLMSGFATLTGCQINNNGRATYDDGSKPITGAVASPSGAVRLTVAAHGYSNGDQVRTSALTGVTGAGGLLAIQVVDANTFDLVGTTFGGTYTANTGSVRRWSGAVQGASNNGAGLVRLNLPRHTFVTDDWTKIAGVTGTTEANGEWKLIIIDANTVDLVGSAFVNAYVSGGLATFVSANVRIGPKAEFVNVSGGLIGAGATGANRAAYDVLNEGKNITVTSRPSNKAALTVKDVSGSATNSIAATSLTMTSGTFVPTVSGTTDGSVVVSYTTQSGTWRKIGDMILWDMALAFTPSTLPGTAETMRLNMPGVAMASVSGYAVAPGSLTALTWPNAATQLVIEPQAGQPYAYIKGQKTGSSTATGTTAMLTAGTAYTIRVGGSYRTT